MSSESHYTDAYFGGSDFPDEPIKETPVSTNLFYRPVPPKPAPVMLSKALKFLLTREIPGLERDGKATLNHVALPYLQGIEAGLQLVNATCQELNMIGALRRAIETHGLVELSLEQ